MSRSHRHTPCATPPDLSAKRWKQHASRVYRRVCRAALTYVDSDTVLPVRNEVSDPYDSPKDGNCGYVAPRYVKHYPRALRK